MISMAALLHRTSTLRKTLRASWPHKASKDAREGAVKAVDQWLANRPGSAQSPFGNSTLAAI